MTVTKGAELLFSPLSAQEYLQLPRDHQAPVVRWVPQRVLQAVAVVVLVTTGFFSSSLRLASILTLPLGPGAGWPTRITAFVWKYSAPPPCPCWCCAALLLLSPQAQLLFSCAWATRQTVLSAGRKGGHCSKMDAFDLDPWITQSADDETEV